MTVDGLFEEPEHLELHKGDRVTVQTIWGTDECTVVAVKLEDGFPMATLKTDSGDTVSVNVARIQEVRK